MQLDPDELLALCRDHLEQNRIEEALLKLKALLAYSNPPAGTHGLAARVYARLRLYDRAIGHLQHCLEQEPDSIERQFELAMVYQDSGDVDTALRHWDAMLVRHPLMPPALFNAAWLLAQKKQIADANRHIEVLLQTSPEDNLYVGRARELQQVLNSAVVALQSSNQ